MESEDNHPASYLEFGIWDLRYLDFGLKERTTPSRKKRVPPLRSPPPSQMLRRGPRFRKEGSFLGRDAEKRIKSGDNHPAYGHPSFER
jgi:hypothetical protein